jgi:hypothetical protein
MATRIKGEMNFMPSSYTRRRNEASLKIHGLTSGGPKADFIRDPKNERNAMTLGLSFQANTQHEHIQSNHPP